jgi:type IV secretory pathway VirB9-like protein
VIERYHTKIVVRPVSKFWERAYATLAFLGGIAALVSAVVLFTGCAATPPPPPPVVVQAAPTPAPIPDPYASLSSDVAAAIKHNQTPTLHHGITLVQPYSPDLQYPLNCQPLHVTQIRLRDDESTDKDNVKVGDRDRWGTIIGDHTVLIFPLGTNTSITGPGAQVRIPADPNMKTNLVIHTSMGNDYVFDPIKIGKPFTPVVSFYYPDYVRAQDSARKQQEATR